MADTTTSATSGFKQDVNRLGVGVDTLRNDMDHLAGSAADAARSGAAELKSGARHAIDAAKEKFEHAKEGASDAVHSVTGVIKRTRSPRSPWSPVSG